MRRLIVAVVSALVVAAPSTALAHSGNPNYRSIVHGIVPALSGVSVSVLGYDNQLQLINRSGKDVTVLGYDGEPYARVLADGTVEQNRNSPATYLNEDRLGDTPVPAFANSKKPPSWQVLDKTGRFIWHDHRMHWMGKTTPNQVSDQHKKTKIFDYRIPISVNGKQANLTGTLFWRGTPKGAPTAAIAALVVLALAAIGFVVWVRRRRRPEPSAAGPPGPREEPTVEAW